MRELQRNEWKYVVGGSGPSVTEMLAEATAIGATAVISKLGPYVTTTGTVAEFGTAATLGGIAAAGLVSAGLVGYQLGTAVYQNSPAVRDAAVSAIEGIVDAAKSLDDYMSAKEDKLTTGDDGHVYLNGVDLDVTGT